ncbi:MAG: UMP kinase, partial [Candidatus Hydrothermarchaeaceae archaeon]
VVGGGRLAREYIEYARSLGGSEEFCDELGISATRMNALLLKAALGDHATEVASGYEGACASKRIFLMGGVKPGQTTDAVAARLAALCKADLFVNATNVDGVYDSDPRRNPGAKMYESMSYDELLELVSVGHTAGISTVMDPGAAHLIRARKIRTIVLDGRDLDNLRMGIKGEEFKGTTIG